MKTPAMLVTLGLASFAPALAWADPVYEPSCATVSTETATVDIANGPSVDQLRAQLAQVEDMEHQLKHQIKLAKKAAKAREHALEQVAKAQRKAAKGAAYAAEATPTQTFLVESCGQPAPTFAVAPVEPVPVTVIMPAALQACDVG